MVSVATEETTGSTGGEEGEGSLLGRFEAETAAFGSSEGLFFEAQPLRVLAIAAGLKEHREIAKERG